MANPIVITYHTEACISQTGIPTAPNTWLGFTLASYLGSQAGVDALTDADWAALATILPNLLSPWRWDWAAPDGVVWSPARPVGAAPTPPPATVGPIQAAMDGLLKDMISARDLRRLSHLNGRQDTSPEWPSLMAQLARLPAAVSHALHLAFVDKIAAPPTSIELVSFRIAGAGGATYAIGTPVPLPSGQSIQLLALASPSPSLADLAARTGLIDGLSRLVLADADPTQATNRNWLVDLPQRLGRAMDPLPRLADLVDKGASLGRPALKAALATLLGGGSPADLAKLLSVVNPLATDVTLGKWASDWLAGLGGRIDAIAPPGDLPSADIRKLGRDGAIRAKIAADLCNLLPPADQTPAVTWFADARNLEAFFTVMLPTAAARDLFRSLAGACAAAMATSADSDLKRLRYAFPATYKAALAKALGVPAAPIDAELTSLAGIQLCTLLTPPATVDAGAEAAVSFPVDAAFATASGLDLHQLYDGYLVAVRKATRGLTDQPFDPAGSAIPWDPFVVASRASLGFGRGPVSPVAGNVPVPGTVGFVVDPAMAAAKIDARHAITRYTGDFLIPWSNRTSPGSPTAPTVAFQVNYDTPNAGDAPAKLGYGRIFQCLVGYQALGGVMPNSFSDGTDPFAFDAVSADPKYLHTKVLLRTQPPGPPRLVGSLEDDGTAFVTSLTGPLDEKVRPLWIERVRGWKDETQRRRFKGLPTCFLGPLDADRGQLRFFVRAPSLSLANAPDPTSTQPDVHVSDPSVWRYWKNRDEDFGAAPTPWDRQRLMVDDPAITSAPKASTAGGRGGCVVRLLTLTGAGVTAAADAPTLYLPLKADDPSPPQITVKCDPAATAATLLPAGAGGVAVTLAEGACYALSFRTVIDADFFGGGADPRLSKWLISGEAAGVGAAWDKPGTAAANGVQETPAETLVVFECLPPAAHLPSADELWRALKLSDDASGQVVARLDRTGIDSFDYVTGLKATRQTWRWDGGPMLEDVCDQLFQSPTAAEPGKDQMRSAAFVAFETDNFVGRGSSGAETNTQIVADSAVTTLFTLDATPNRGAGYLRVRAEASSRYTALRAVGDPDGVDLRARSSAKLEGGGLSPWRALLLKARRRDPLPTPKVRIATPLFGAIGAGLSAGGFAVFLDEPAYDVRDGAGLAERIEAEILVEIIDIRLDQATGLSVQPGLTAAAAFGPDPILTGGLSPDDCSPIDAPAGPPANMVDRIYGANGSDPATAQWTPPIGAWWSPATGVGVRIHRAAVLGETLEPDSAAPIIAFATVMFDPIIETMAGGRTLPLKPGTMARIRLRRRPDPAMIQPLITANPADEATALASPWSAPVWIHLMGDAGHQARLGCVRQVGQTGGDQIVVSPDPTDPAALRLFARWANLPTAQDTELKVGPMVDGALEAVVGLLASDVSGDSALRPLCVLSGVRNINALNLAAQNVTFDLKNAVMPSGQALSLPAKAACFLQILEVQSVRSHDRPEGSHGDPWFAPAGPTAARAGPRLANSTPDVAERVVSMGPRLYFTSS